MAYRVTATLEQDYPGVGFAGDIWDEADFSQEETARSYAEAVLAGARRQRAEIVVEVGYVYNFDANILPGN